MTFLKYSKEGWLEVFARTEMRKHCLNHWTLICSLISHGY